MYCTCMGYFNLSKQLIRLRGQICVVLKGTVSRDFWPFLGKKNSIWTPYEQAKTIYLEVVFVFRKIFMKTYVHWLLTLLTWFLHSYWRCFHGVSWHCPFNPQEKRTYKYLNLKKISVLTDRWKDIYIHITYVHLFQRFPGPIGIKSWSFRSSRALHTSHRKLPRTCRHWVLLHKELWSMTDGSRLREKTENNVVIA